MGIGVSERPPGLIGFYYIATGCDQNKEGLPYAF